VPAPPAVVPRPGTGVKELAWRGVAMGGRALGRLLA